VPILVIKTIMFIYNFVPPEVFLDFIQINNRFAQRKYPCLWICCSISRPHPKSVDSTSRQSTDLNNLARHSHFDLSESPALGGFQHQHMKNCYCAGLSAIESNVCRVMGGRDGKRVHPNQTIFTFYTRSASKHQESLVYFLARRNYVCFDLEIALRR
jgi:hypothetical protein